MQEARATMLCAYAKISFKKMYIARILVFSSNKSQEYQLIKGNREEKDSG